MLPLAGRPHLHGDVVGFFDGADAGRGKRFDERGFEDCHLLLNGDAVVVEHGSVHVAGNLIALRPVFFGTRCSADTT